MWIYLLHADPNSLKSTGASWVLAGFSWNALTGTLAVLATVSTIIYNVIKIRKELKKPDKEVSE
jgi:hypothetical protein